MSSQPSGSPSPPAQSPLRQALREIVDPFKSLATSPRALWGLYVSYLLEGLVYFGILTILGKYLSENVGLADLHAGWVYSGFTGGITLAMLFLGGVADRIGVRRALVLSLGMMVIGRGVLASSGTFFAQEQGAGSPMFFAVVLGLFVVVLGYGTYQPAAYSAVKRFTDEKSASMGYAMIYGLMNLGAFFSGIISPPVRKAMGIESVYWVYTALTVLAVLTVVFVMTRRVVERDTRTRIDAEKPAPGTEADRASSGPSVWTPTFLVLLIATLVSAGFLVRTAVTAQPGPGQAALTAARVALADAGDAVAADTTGAARLQDLATALDRVGEQAAAVAAPPATGDAPVADQVFALARSRLEQVAAVDTLLTGPVLAAEFPVGEDTGAMSARGDLRSTGLWAMAAAYAMVSPVDAAVLENLRLRMKTPEEEILPLDGALREQILASVTGEPHAMVTDVRDALARTAGQLDSTQPELAAVIAPLLRTEADFLDAAAAAVRATEGPAAERVGELAKERLLELSVLLLREWPPLLAEGVEDEDAPEEAAPVVGAEDLLGAWLGEEMVFAAHLREAVGQAVMTSSSQRLADWAVRYGLWVLALVVLVVQVTRYLLARNPEHPFHDRRFVFFIFVLVPVQTLFAHNWLTLPYYIDRAFGGTTVGENFEFFSNLNPILIFFLAPVVAALTARSQVYRMMIIGTLVMAAPTFLLALPPTPAFLMTYIVLMSIGEAMWQPRFLQWVAEIAPEGKTGAYMGIGQFPWFLTKVLTGLYSGAFLSAYCPVVGPQNTQFMWLIYGIIAMVSPVGLVLARNWMLRGKRAM